MRAQYEFDDLKVDVNVASKDKVIGYRIYSKGKLIFKQAFKDTILSAIIKATSCMSSDIKKGATMKDT